MFKVTCDKGCQKEFTVNKEREELTFQDEAYGEVVFIYFTCPHCKVKYLVYTENAIIKELIEDTKLARAEMYDGIKKTEKENFLRMAKVQKNMRTIQRLQGHLKGKYHFI